MFKTRFACIETATFARKVKVTIFILMKTVIFICRGRHEGIANGETYMLDPLLSLALIGIIGK